METARELSFLSVLLPLLGVIFIIAVGVILLNQHFQRNLSRQKLQEEELKNQQQKELLKSSIQVQETERKRIARDLHDELGATLSIARMHIVRLEQSSQLMDDSFASLQNIRMLTETALASLRKISHELMPPQLETFGLVKTLRAFSEQINQLNELKLDLNLSPQITRMPWEVEVALYRVSMELVQNTLKHAQAKRSEITIDWLDDQRMVFSYSDDGTGFPLEVNGIGLGLRSVEARVNALGGTFELRSEKGFEAKAIIPLDLIKKNE